MNEGEPDNVDFAMEQYLSTDTYGSKIKIPVIRLKSGSFMIGLLKYGLRIDDENELVGGISGL